MPVCRLLLLSAHGDRLVGLAVKASALRATDPVLDSHLRRRDFFALGPTSDFRIGTPVATLPGA